MKIEKDLLQCTLEPSRTSDNIYVVKYIDEKGLLQTQYRYFPYLCCQCCSAVWHINRTRSYKFNALCSIIDTTRRNYYFIYVGIFSTICMVLIEDEGHFLLVLDKNDILDDALVGIDRDNNCTMSYSII